MRFLNKIYAYICGYFWKPCPICGKYFGGHEVGKGVLVEEEYNYSVQEIEDNEYVITMKGKCICKECSKIKEYWYLEDIKQI